MSRPWRRIGATRPTPTSSKRGCARTASTASRRCCWCIARPRPASSIRSPNCAGRSMRQASGAVPGRYDLLARLDRFPDGRMGRRCRRRRLAEGADAADRHGLYRGQRQGAGSERRREIAARLLGLAAAPGRRLAGLLERHGAGAFLLRSARGAAHAGRRGARQRLCPPSSAGRGDAWCGAGLDRQSRPRDLFD